MKLKVLMAESEKRFSQFSPLKEQDKCVGDIIVKVAKYPAKNQVPTTGLLIMFQ